MGVKFSNNAATVLSASITDVATSFDVDDVSEFPAVGGADYMYLTLANVTTIEVVKVTAVSGTTLTVTRAQDGTSASAFNLGDACELRVTAGVLIDALAELQPLDAVLTATTASFLTADKSKLDGIESGATADQTDAEIAAAVEAAVNSNTFTDADHSKLDGIAAGANVGPGLGMILALGA
jgi:hypothetical protein